MKKRILGMLILILLVGGIMVLFNLLRKHAKTIEIDQATGLPVKLEEAQPVLFESFRFHIIGMSVEADVVVGGKTETGAYLEYCTEIERYNSESGEEETERYDIHRIEGDEQFYHTLCQLLGVYGVTGWDGFVGKNPPGVRDGESGSFRATLSDGSTIEAHGSNNFPQNYHSLYSLLRKMVDEKSTEETDR